jgi:hypothetical protein
LELIGNSRQVVGFRPEEGLAKWSEALCVDKE